VPRGTVGAVVSAGSGPGLVAGVVESETGASLLRGSGPLGGVAKLMLVPRSPLEIAMPAAVMRTMTQLPAVRTIWRCRRCRRLAAPTDVAYS
jgi:hypothetical protein